MHNVPSVFTEPEYVDARVVLLTWPLLVNEVATAKAKEPNSDDSPDEARASAWARSNTASVSRQARAYESPLVATLQG